MAPERGNTTILIMMNLRESHFSLYHDNFEVPKASINVFSAVTLIEMRSVTYKRIPILLLYYFLNTTRFSSYFSFSLLLS